MNAELLSSRNLPIPGDARARLCTSHPTHSGLVAQESGGHPGSRDLEGFVPDQDATIVARILDAGAEIVGKAVCEHLCFSDGSHTSDTSPVLNPHAG
ncbi:MAG: hypothetical protein HYY64_03265 [Candidatus Rokubacteria bacterium]|nr:hypothetical protein [Candidatus Rokubacteria bacterium]